MRAHYVARIALVLLGLVAIISAIDSQICGREAHAQQGPTLQISPATAAPGEAVTLQGAGWPAGAAVTTRMYDASAVGGPSAPLGGVIQADQEGSFSVQGAIPLTLFSPDGAHGNVSAVPGEYTVVAFSGPTITAGAGFTVGSPSQKALLWGEVAFDSNGNRRRDESDILASNFALVTVTDDSGARGFVQVFTDARGRYMAPSLDPGSYQLAGQAQFRNGQWSAQATADVQNGQAVRVDLLLSPKTEIVHPERYFQETGFYVENDDFWDYFTHRGGIRTLGYPISRTFQFQGYPTQFFQRVILQDVPGQGVQRLNLLDPGLLPYIHINGSQFPAVDPQVKAAAPVVGSPDYDTQVVDFVREYAPNEVGGRRVGFFDAFMSTVTAQDAFPEGDVRPELLPLMNLEIWGVPTSRPAQDPNNADFVYMRFQRGILHYQGQDAQGNPITEGILLGDWFKSLITGRDLPADLEAEARADNSPFLRQYDPNSPNWVARTAELPDTDLTFAFERQQE